MARKRKRRSKRADNYEQTPPPNPNSPVPIGQSDPPPEAAPANDLDAVHAEAIERYEAGWEKDRANQDASYDDLRFLAEEEAQWDGRALSERRNDNRPVLTVNKLPQFIRQVTGDIRQLRPAIHVVPIDERASEMVSVKVMPEMIRYIERRSDAKAAYFSAADQMVAAGIGHCRVFTEYAAGTTFNQEIAIGIMPDGLSVVWDPDSIHPTRKDAIYCFVPIDMNRKRAAEKWPDKAIDSPLPAGATAFAGWSTDEHVRVAEYWRKCPYECELALYPDGKIVDLTDDTVAAETESGSAQRAELQAEDEYADEDENAAADNAGEEKDYRVPAKGGIGPKRADAIAAGARIEKRDSFRIERYILSATEVLEGPDYWPGKHIPIVPFMGEEIKIGRQVTRRGIIRALKDVQRLYNYAISADAEAVALQPKAPFKGTRKNFEEHLDEWETANSKNWPFLTYTPDPENGGRPPEREPPPVASTGIRELLNTATSDMSAITGIYPASLGQGGPESSGKAITARQREGDTGTYVYIESFARAVQRVGEIIVDLIPHVYDTERTLRVVGDDGKAVKVEINKEMIDPNGDGIDTVTFNDVTVGTYAVSVEMGPSFSTKREEARDGMQTLMQSLGQQVAPLFADLYVKGQDFPLADQIAGRLKFLLPPHIAAAEAAISGEPPPQQPPPPPPTPEQQQAAAEMQFKMQELQGKAALEAAKLDLANAGLDVEKQKLQAEMIKVDLEMQKARMAHEQAQLSNAAAMAKTQAEAEEGMLTRDHEMRMNGNGAASPRESGDQQQQAQIDALIEAVAKLQEAVTHIADAVDGGGNGQMPPVPPVPPSSPGMPSEMLSTITDAIGQAMNKPRKAVIERDPRTGKVIGATSIVDGG